MPKLNTILDIVRIYFFFIVFTVLNPFRDARKTLILAGYAAVSGRKPSEKEIAIAMEQKKAGAFISTLPKAKIKAVEKEKDFFSVQLPAVDFSKGIVVWDIIERYLTKPLYLFIFFAIVYTVISFVPRSEGMAWTNGDEPHYIMQTYALVQDGSLQNMAVYYEDEVWKEWYNAPLIPHMIGLNGKLYAYHQIGFSYYLIPGYILGGLRGVWISTALAVSVGMIGMYFLLSYYFTRRITLITTLITGLSLPVGIFSNQIYPEILLFALVTCTTAYIMHPRFRFTWISSIALALILAYIPTLHIKFIVISGMIAFFINVQQYFKKMPLYRIFLFDVFIGGLILLYLGWLNSYYDGNFKGAMDAIAANTTLSLLEVPTGLLGILVDRENGILIFSPFYIYCLYGWWIMVKKALKMKLAQAIQFLFPIALTTAFTIFFTMFPYVMGGMNPPGRYNLPVMGGMGVMLGFALVETFSYKTGRVIAGILFAYTLTVFIILCSNPILQMPFGNETMLFFWLFKGNAHSIINGYLPNLSKYFRIIPFIDLVKGIGVFSFLILLTRIHLFVDSKDSSSRR